MEMRCYRKIHKDHATNKEVCAKIQQAIRPREDLLTIIKGCKLQWYGHVSRSSGLAKIICGAPTTLAVKGLMMMMMRPTCD